MVETSPPAQLPNPDELWEATLGWSPTEAQQRQFQTLYEAVLAQNRHLNLTRITDPEAFWEKHLWDSLSGPASLELVAGDRAIDIGTGAGLPGLPVAIAYPQVAVTLLEATGKKASALERIVAELAIDNAVPLAGRAEQIGRQAQHREAYSLALLRAVGRTVPCAEYALPLLERGGIAILYRGRWDQAQADAVAAAAKQLGGTVAGIEDWTTPLTQAERHCIYLEKTGRTPARFPRAPGVPAREPL